MMEAAPDRAEIADFAVAIERVGASDLPLIEKHWRALEQDADVTFFTSWRWMGRWLKEIDAAPYVARVRRGGRIVGMAFLCRKRITNRRFLPSQVVFLNQTGDPDQDVITIEYNRLLSARGEAAAAEALVRFLRRTPAAVGGGWDEFQVSGAVDDTLASFDAGGLPRRSTAIYGSYAVDLAALRREDRDYLSSLSSNTRRQIRRAVSLYEERGPVRLKRAENAEEALSFFEDAARMHEAKWSAQGRKGALSHPFYMAFNRALIPDNLGDGGVDLLKIAAGDHVIGYLYNLLYKGHVGFYLSGLAFEKDNRLKPGLVCHAAAITHYRDAGADVYDFLAGDARYKASLGDRGETMRTVLYRQPRVKLQVEEALRTIKHFIAPPDKT